MRRAVLSWHLGWVDCLLVLSKALKSAFLIWLCGWRAGPRPLWTFPCPFWRSLYYQSSLWLSSPRPWDAIKVICEKSLPRDSRVRQGERSMSTLGKTGHSCPSWVWSVDRFLGGSPCCSPYLGCSYQKPLNTKGCNAWSQVWLCKTESSDFCMSTLQVKVDFHPWL